MDRKMHQIHRLNTKPNVAAGSGTGRKTDYAAMGCMIPKDSDCLRAISAELSILNPQLQRNK